MVRLTWLIACALAVLSARAQAPVAYEHPIPFAPQQYLCYRSPEPIRIDGSLADAAWARAPWTADFTDIEGSRKPAPPLRTRARMLWDDDYFYIAAELAEPHLWANLTQRDAVIFHDDDFEVFIDPDGDGRHYAELEMNALNTVWDLLLFAPYHLGDAPPYTNHWDIRGLKTAVQLQGTLNRPEDSDYGWSIEIAIPFSVLAELGLHKGRPMPGEQWRVNFSRVDWQVEPGGNAYRKKINPATGRPFPESNWVWSPTGRIDMHRPEAWGWVQFSALEGDDGRETFRQRSAHGVSWALWQLFYSQKLYRQQYGTYATALSQLKIPSVTWPGYTFAPEMSGDGSYFIFRAPDAEGKVWSLSDRGRLESK